MLLLNSADLELVACVCVCVHAWCAHAHMHACMRGEGPGRERERVEELVQQRETLIEKMGMGQEDILPNMSPVRTQVHH